MEQPFQLRPVDVVEGEAGDDRGRGKKESRIVDRIDDASMDIAAGHADLHHPGSMRSDCGVLRERSRHIDMTRRHVGIVGLLLEQGTRYRVRDTSPVFVVVQGGCEGAKQGITFGAVIVYDP